MHKINISVLTSSYLSSQSSPQMSTADHQGVLFASLACSSVAVLFGVCLVFGKLLADKDKLYQATVAEKDKQQELFQMQLAERDKLLNTLLEDNRIEIIQGELSLLKQYQSEFVRSVTLFFVMRFAQLKGLQMIWWGEHQG